MLICVSLQICSWGVNFSTSLLSLASMDYLVISLSCSTVVEAVSSLFVYLIFLLPSKHAHTLILNYLFLTKTISKDSSSVLYFLIILLVSIGITVSISWICVNSVFTAFLSFSTNILKKIQVVLFGSQYIPPSNQLQRLLTWGSFRYNQHLCWRCHHDSPCFRNLVCTNAWFASSGRLGIVLLSHLFSWEQ